jgi:energy-coupling factor transport system permease protein
MYWLSSGFIFRRVDSPIHRLDPRVRLLFSVELFALSLTSGDVLEVALTIATILALASVGRILRRMGRTMVFSTTFAALILVVNLLVGYPLIDAAVLAARFIAIVGSTSLFFLATSPDELEYVMKWFRFPQDLVFAFVTAVRFVPVLMLDALQIVDAQKSRGLELERGNLLTRIRNFTPILVPLVVNAVVRSGELAEAMETRAYGAVKRPTSLYTLRFTRRDVAVSLLSLALTTVTLYYFIL